MLPRIKQQASTETIYQDFLNQLKNTSFSGDISNQLSDRLVVAVDNSIYQILPQAVVYPKNHQDIQHLFQLASQKKFNAIKLSPRGAGTSTCGQSLTTGIIIDHSRHMNQILAFDEKEQWVRVQPGVVLDQLQEFLQTKNLWLPVRISTGDRATLGGMVNTDASGLGSMTYGKTSDSLLELRCVLADGSELTSKPMSLAELETAKQNTHGHAYQVIDNILHAQEDNINKTFPTLGKRCMTGYNLAKIYNESRDTFNLNYLLAGSEGTLACITEIQLKIIPPPKYKTLCVVKYPSFLSALADTQAMINTKPNVIEVVDETIVELAKQDAVYHDVKDLLGDDARALVFIETYANTQAAMSDKNTQLEKALQQNQAITDYYLTSNPNEMEALWQLRKKSVGLLANLPGNRQPIPFIEDSIVPPEYLEPYTRELIALLKKHHLQYGIFGHTDVGCLHVRPALDTQLPQDEKLIQSITDAVVILLKKYHGILWGEHGKGFRSHYGPEFFGDELYQCLREIKSAFDPNNRLNPGKIATPLHSDEHLVTLHSPMRGHFDKQIAKKTRHHFKAPLQCNGNEACMSYQANNVMCPSAKATREQLHSPKGRSTVMREWLRRLSENHYDTTKSISSHWLKRLYNTALKHCGQYDFSHEVLRAMNGCLECKACQSQCPVHVDVPAFKAQFLAHYYSRYCRSLKDIMIAYAEPLARLQAKIPPLAQRAAFLPRIIGLINTPTISRIPLKHVLKKCQAKILSAEKIKRLNEKNLVVLVQDFITTYYEPQVLLATYDLLISLGYHVVILKIFDNGAALHSKGYLKQFNTLAHSNIQQLNQLKHKTLIGIEPSLTLTLRDEYPKVTKAHYRVQLLQEWLATQPLQPTPHQANKTFQLFTHCQEKNLNLDSNQQWQKVFTAFGLKLEIISTGCCGMAGSYGYDKHHQTESKALFDMSWKKHFTEENKDVVLCTGFSCRKQVERFTGYRPQHPIELISAWFLPTKSP